MPRIQTRKAVKAATKKATQKVAKKAVKKTAKKATRKVSKKTDKSEVFEPKLDQDTLTSDSPEQLKDCPEGPARDTYAEAGTVNSFDALLLQAPNPVVTARARVIHSVQQLISASIDGYTARNEEEPVRAYVRSVQETAAREFDMALHLLESEIRR